MKLFYEKYIKLAHIGKGANAHVYKVRHAELGYVRAIKVLNEYIEDKNERVYQSFLKECKTLLAIGNGSHPNIVRIYGPDLIENRAIVEMDYVQGMTLDSYIKKKGFLDYEEIKTFIHDIVGALAYTHHDIYKFLMNPEEDDLQTDPNDGQKFLISSEKEAELVKKYGIVHNDLHSNNVIRRDYDGRFVLLDFGLAVQDGECIKSSRKSDGSPEYKSPEKFDSGEITPRSDVYSLGVLIYEALTGRPPFVLDIGSDGKVSYPALSKISDEHHNQTPPSILPLRKASFERNIPGAVYERDYPEWLDTVVMKCLAKNPEDRYSDAKELLDDINWHISHEKRDTTHSSPSPDTPPPSIPKPKANNKNLLFVVGGCVILMAALLCYFFLFSNDHHEYIPVEEIELPKNEYSLNVGDSTAIIPKILPADASDTTINWVSTNPDVVTVLGDNWFKATKAGSTNLIAASKDGKTKVQVSVTVRDAEPPMSEKSGQPSENETSGLSNENPNESTSHEITTRNPREEKGTHLTPVNPTNPPTHINIPGSIQESLNMLIDGSISIETRLNSIPKIMNKFFEPGAKICTVSDSDIILDTENAEDFLRRIVLSKRISRIIITETETYNKITELRIKEKH